MSGLVSGLSESGDLLGRCLCGWTGPRVSATALSVHVGVLSGLSYVVDGSESQGLMHMFQR
jgi:hypothetical protein